MLVLLLLFPIFFTSTQCVSSSIQDCRLYWLTFRARDNHSEVVSHKRFILRSHSRLRGFFPLVTEEAAIAHDDSKLTFLEMTGYTDRWIWGRRASAVWDKGTWVA